MQIGIGGKAGNTFGAYAVDGDGDGISNVYNPADAIFTAASYLCRNGGGKGGDLSRAVFAYNHADWYVTKVLTIASTYEAATPAPWGGGPAAPPNHDVAAIAIQFAYNQLGKPYVWGAEGDNFYDCSGLMQRAYKEARGPAAADLPRAVVRRRPGRGPRQPPARRPGVRGQEPLRPQHDLPRRHVHRCREHDRGPLHRCRGPDPTHDPQ